MTLDQFVSKWLGKKADFDGVYQGQCVDLFRFYVKEVLGNPQPKGVVGAADFWSNYDTDPNLNQFFTKIPNTPTGVPAKGDVVLWTRRAGDGFGHVSIFLNGDVNGFTSLDQNWPTLSKVTKTDHNYTNVYGWLRPKEKPMANELETCLKDRQKFWDERDDLLRALNAGSVEEGKSTIAGYKSRNTDLANQVGTLQAEVDNRKQQVSRVEAQLLSKSDEIKFLDTQLQKARQDAETYARERGLQAIETEKLRAQLETLKQQQQQGEVTITFADLWKLIWNQKIVIRR